MAKIIGENIAPNKMQLYRELLASHPEIELKGKNNPYTSHNGHMFTFISKDGVLAIRLPKEERNKFLEKYNTTLMESYGAVMKEYVRVPDNMLSDTNLLKKYLGLSYNYIKSLEPKSTKKK